MKLILNRQAFDTANGNYLFEMEYGKNTQLHPSKERWRTVLHAFVLKSAQNRL
ncbi:MAG: hypothetical protein IPM39_20370 [Chloroflexi bacterium]|nr:hypothetical protein [Chloroflexota bacterium]